MASRIISVWSAIQQTQFIKSLRTQIERLTDDEQAIRDTLEGEIDTEDYNAIMTALLVEMHTLKADAKAKRELASDWMASARASEEKAERIKGHIDEAMRAAQRRDWKGPAGTIYYGEGKDNAHIVDETKVPLELWRSEIDKSRVNDIALDVHRKRQDVINDARLTKEDKDSLLSQLKQIDGVEVRKGSDFIVIRAPSKGKGDV